MSDLEILSAPKQDESIDTWKMNLANVAPKDSWDKYISAREIVQDATSSLWDSRSAWTAIVAMIAQKWDEFVSAALEKINALISELEEDYEKALNEKLKVKN